MTSKRKVQLDKQLRRTIAAGYDNFADGMLRAFHVDPRNDKKTGTHLRSAFTCAYPVFEWCRTIKRSGKARVFLVETQSALSLAVALAGVGIYEVANLQLRYTCECIMSFLYFRDHPRELELALKDSDQWDLTRPRAVLKFLRKLPEFATPIGLQLLDSLNMTYGELCRYAHPRQPSFMAQRRYLAQISLNSEHAESFSRGAKALCSAAAGLFWLAYPLDYVKSGELVQLILRKPLKSTLRNRIIRASQG